MNMIGKGLVVGGVVMVVVGVVLIYSGKIPFLGRLPGDILIKRGNVTFYFPFASGLLISLLLSLLFHLFKK